jgi:hypothetical protein
VTETEKRREGTTDDIAGLRMYYRQADGVERSVDWRNDRGPTVAEAVAVKKTCLGVSVPRMLMVLRSSDAAWDDPEALQAVVWMVRRLRDGEVDCKFPALADIDLLSLRQEFIAADGVLLDLKEPEPDPAAAQLAADVAAAIGDLLPTLPHAEAFGVAAALVAAAAREETAEGEAGAGAGPAAGETPPSTPTT